MVLALLHLSAALDVSSSPALLGRRALLMAGCPEHPERTLAIADTLLAGGAQHVRLLCALPSSGPADEGSWQLAQSIQRRGFSRLMEALGYASGNTGLSGAARSDLYAVQGNRPRVSSAHVRADDVEQLSLNYVDADLLLLHTPRREPMADLAVERARFAMHRRCWTFLLARLRDGSHALQRDTGCREVSWAWITEQAQDSG